MATTGPIATFGTITPGTGYATGTYPGVQLTGGSGSGAIATLVVDIDGHVVQVTFTNPSAHQQLDRTGKNYQVGDVLSARANFDGFGLGTGFAVAVGTLAKACENCFYGKIVPSGPNFGLRFCGNDAFQNIQQPQPSFNPTLANAWLSNVTPDDYFCGDGVDLTALTSFSAGVTQNPIQSAGFVTGTIFTSAGVSSIVVADGRLNLIGATKVFFTPANSVAATFMVAHGLFASISHGGGAITGFQMSTGDGANFTGAETYNWMAVA